MHLHGLAIRQDDFWRVCLYRPGLQSPKRLRHNLVGLFHLAHAHKVTRPHVAVGFNWDFEVVFLIPRVRISAANVEVNSAAAQAWTRKAPVNGILGGDYTDALRSLLKNS